MKLRHKLLIFFWSAGSIMGMLGGISLLLNREYGIGTALLTATVAVFGYGVHRLGAAATREQLQRRARVQRVLEQHGVAAEKSQQLYQRLQYELHGFTRPRDTRK